MTKLFLSVYDFLSKRKTFSVILLVLCIAVSLLLSLRLRYKENVADFLPQDNESRKYTDIYNEMGDNGQITLIFRPDTTLGLDEEELRIRQMDAMDLFEEQWNKEENTTPLGARLSCRVNDSEVFDAMDYIRNNIALFLLPEDYLRIDSLLAQPEYVSECLQNVKRMVSFPMMQVMRETVLSDPLNLFSPALQRLSSLGFSENFQVEEEYLFDKNGIGYAFLYTPYPVSDTKGNGLISKRVEKVLESMSRQCEGVEISAVGASLIAVTNASQIKKDSLLSMIIAVLLIAIVLFVAMGRKRNVFWIVFSILAGWLFALAAIALFKPGISIIVIGIGSVLVGIAVNYPLHFLDHLREQTDRRKALKEMVDPLVTGNITTVSAFACLLFVRAEAMRDLGLFGALLLVGCILFVLVFLPLFAKPGMCGIKDDVKDESLSPASYRSSKKARLALIPVLLVTIVLAIFSTNTSFDDNLHNINYMTPQQQSDLKLLEQTTGETSQGALVYLVSEASDWESVLRNQELFWDSLGSGLLEKVSFSGVNLLLPSLQRQADALEQWSSFCDRYSGLAQQVEREAVRIGFRQEAFSPFVKLLHAEYNAVPVVEMKPLMQLCKPYMLHRGDSLCLVSFMHTPKEDCNSVKSLVNDWQKGNLFAFDASNVGNNLVRALNDDFNYILFVCSFVVFFFLWLSLGRLELALLSFLPLTVGWLWILGLMDIFAVKFNIVNIILATFIFGQGDDYTIFITEGMMYEYAYNKKRLSSYRRSVVISAILMFIGIGSLIFAKHPAMRSLAEVAMIGMASVVLMACYLPPLIYRWMVYHKGALRQVPVTLKRIVYTFICFLVFFLVAFVIVTPFTLLYRFIGKESEEKRFRYHRIIHWCMVAATKYLPGVRFHLENPLQESFSKPGVIIANHQSHLDLLCILMLHPKIVIMTNDWVWHNPIYGLIIRYAEFYPCSNGYDSNFPKLQALVERGYSVMIFPEGTRSMDGKIGRFHNGAFMLAQQLGVDIIPVLIHGAYHVLPKWDFLFREGDVTIRVEERISSAGFSNRDVREIAQEFRRLYSDKYEIISREKENAAYFSYLVRHQYLYKGRVVARRSRKMLADVSALRADNIKLGQGEQPLLWALSHPGEEFAYTFDNEDDYLLASNCAIMPPNLHYKLREGGIKGVAEGDTIKSSPDEKIFCDETETLIMGGGLGGLLTGALLAHSGQKVTVLEKNAVVGGGLQCFRRGDALFPTGMHLFGGYREGGPLHKIFSYLGLTGKLEIVDTDADVFDEVVYTQTGEKYCFPTGREAYTQYLCKLFPHERNGIESYVEAIYRLSEEEDLFYLRKVSSSGLSHSEEFYRPVGEFIANYIKDEKLQSLLSYAAPLYAGVKEETPAYIHALIHILHIEGSSYFAKGSQQLADQLVAIIKNGGGRVLTGEEVTGVEVENHQVKLVKTRSGSCYTASNYISDLHPCLLLQLVPENAFPPSFRERINAAPETYSAFKLYIRFKPNSFKHVNHPVYGNRAGSAWQLVQVPVEQWPQGLMCMTFPDENGEYAKIMTVVAAMDYDWTRQWEDTVVNHRGDSYLEWKRERTGQMLSIMEELFPGIRESVDCTYASSPLTLRDYLGNRRGSMYGLHIDGNHYLQTQLFVQTKVKNLYLTGQNTNLHGMCGVALTAVATACTVLHNDNLINQISKEK